MNSIGSYQLGEKNIEFTTESGKVSNSSANSVTTTTQTGGNVSVTNSWGMTANSKPTVRHHTTHSLDFWLTTNDGKEKKFTFNNCILPLKDGHEVTVINANSEDLSFPYYLVNHNTGENVAVYGQNGAKLTSLGGWKYFGIAILAFFSTIYLFESFSVSALLFFILFPSIPLFNMIKLIGPSKKMDEFLKEKIQSILEPAL